jgi:thiol-disulfide isomerase/thioredoxin
MSKTLDYLNNLYIKPYKRIILIVCLVILFVSVSMIGYRWYIQPAVNKKNTDDVANSNRRNQTADIFFFHADWCPHCKKAEPEWAQFRAKYDNQSVNNYTIHCIDINCTDPDNASAKLAIDKFGVEHFPTVKMVKDDYTVDFDAKISADSLDKFVTATLK